VKRWDSVYWVSACRSFEVHGIETGEGKLDECVKDLVEFGVLDNGLLIKFGGGVSYAENIQSVQVWTTDGERK